MHVYIVCLLCCPGLCVLLPIKAVEALFSLLALFWYYNRINTILYNIVNNIIFHLISYLLYFTYHYAYHSYSSTPHITLLCS